MAKSLLSPGVKITEKDLSLRSSSSTPDSTTILLAGFAQQGPTNEPIYVTSMSEYEASFGTPITPAESYLYHSTKEALNSPGTVIVTRLPYGANSGSGFSKSYSALMYPVSNVNGDFELGAPTHVELTPSEYKAIEQGNFSWSSLADSGDAGWEYTNESVGSISAGLIILNDLQTTVNELGEGYYIGIADNSSLVAGSPDFDSIVKISSLTGENQFAEISTDRIDFALSATNEQSILGVTSISETLEKVGFVGFETTEYQDHLVVGVFKVRTSTSDGTLLSLGTQERYYGSLNAKRKQISPTGGTIATAFLEDKLSSPVAKVLINPAISTEHNWTVNSSLPTSKITINSDAKALYAIGSYVSDTTDFDTNKVIGNIPSKLEKAFRLLESPDNITVDVVVDGGLTSIYAHTMTVGGDSFDDAAFISTGADTTYVGYWSEVAGSLTNFCEETRRDCVAILDIPRPTVLIGTGSKVIDAEGKTFSTDIYPGMKAAAVSITSNYAALYGQWVRVSDPSTGRPKWAPFSGYGAAVYARNDDIAEQWYAPAGLNRGTFKVADIAFNPNQKQRDRLYEIAVNPVVYFNRDGYAVMGQKTLQKKPTAFDRVNVRRLFLALERATQRSLKYFVFEPNTEATRTRLVNTIDPIFAYAKQTEGVYDYLIVCDERNNTPDSIDENQLIVDIYIKPVRAAEFILVNFVATRSNQNFEELI